MIRTYVCVALAALALAGCGDVSAAVRSAPNVAPLAGQHDAGADMLDATIDPSALSPARAAGEDSGRPASCDPTLNCIAQ